MNPLPSTALFPADVAEGVVLLGVVGSTAYGLATESSDLDYLATYVAPTREVLGLNGAAVGHAKCQRHDPADASAHEVGKFLSLCAKGNPPESELLWLPSYVERTELGELLIGVRRSLLSTSAVRSAYCHYAAQQARWVYARTESDSNDREPDRRTAKRGRHSLRLLIQARSALSTGEIRIDVSDHRAEIFAVGEMAEQDPAAFRELFEARLRETEAIESVLPDSPDLAAVNDALVQVRLASLR